jgi:hypothetical protein
VNARPLYFSSTDAFGFTLTTPTCNTKWVCLSYQIKTIIDGLLKINGRVNSALVSRIGKWMRAQRRERKKERKKENQTKLASEY